ncbi:glycosyltransferase [Patescibacteria group bacterium]
MNNNITSVLIFWGIWVILPVAIDGLLTFVYTTFILISKVKNRFRKKPSIPKKLPMVSVIIPAYNEEQNISTCLNFLKIQTYPHEKMEIIVVDNGSIDDTSKLVLAHKQENGSSAKHDDSTNHSINKTKINGKIKFYGRTYQTKEYNGSLHLITHKKKGKAQALNAGIKKSEGDIIINIDSRAFLDPNAISEIVKAFNKRKDMGAATGNIEVNWKLIYQHNPLLGFTLDQNGYLVNKTLSVQESFIAKSQFLEYLASFHIGRYFLDVSDSMYTMSGAFSAIRREALLKTNLYQDKTVVEDTHLTLDLGDTQTHVGYVPTAKAYLRPVNNWERLYSQRIRWRRGQIEVMGMYYSKLNKKKFSGGRAIMYPLTLVIDHTFAFPRLIWFFILPSLILFGYHINVVIIAILLMLGFYALLDFFNTGFCYLLSDQNTRGQIRNAFHWIILLPVYRLILFFIRVSSYLVVLREEQEWTVQNNLVGKVKKFRLNAKQRLATSPINGLGKAWFMSKKNLNIQPKSEGKKP